MLIRVCLYSAALFSFGALSSGCASNDDRTDSSDEEAAEEISPRIAGALQDGEEPRELVTQARATIEPLGDSGLSGTVTFAPSDLGMQVTYMLDGLTEGVYGFHVHENGSCANGEDGAAGGAAGGHFNPGGVAHGAPNLPVGQRHLGDLGNIHALSDGRILGSFNESIASLDGPESIVGKALIIHADEDDFMTQPTGNAGARIGCGVITGVEV